MNRDCSNSENTINGNLDSIFDKARAFNKKWQELCLQFLPFFDPATIWRYSRHPNSGDPDQGWKLHVSATILTANEVLASVAPILHDSGVLYKAPASLRDLEYINSGIVHDYAQVGKFITVYPQNDQEAVFLAERLHQLTRSYQAPGVPFDFRYKPKSCVYYRYGAFKSIEMETGDGVRTLALRDPSGKLVPDLRETEHPDWAENPFPKIRVAESRSKISRNATNYKVLGALAQRGKGGVYQAIDFSSASPRLCIIKEGRKNGETRWDGLDGYWRVQHEKQMLKAMRSAGIDVPETYASYKAAGNYYLVIEFVEGENLIDLLQKRKRRLTIKRALKFSVQIAQILNQIHTAGFVWRDLKPANLIVTRDEQIRPIDFEGACRAAEPDSLPWGTESFMSPIVKTDFLEHSSPFTDLFALGTVLYFLFEGNLPRKNSDSESLRFRRNNVPSGVRQIISQLLSLDIKERPSAETVYQNLLKQDLPAKKRE